MVPFKTAEKEFMKDSSTLKRNMFMLKALSKNFKQGKR